MVLPVGRAHDPHHGVADLRIVGDVDEVAGRSQLGRPGDRVPVDLGDDRLGEVPDAEPGVVGLAGPLPIAGRRVEGRVLHQRRAAEVVPGREARSGAPDDGDPHVGVDVVGPERVEQLRPASVSRWRCASPGRFSVMRRRCSPGVSRGERLVGHDPSLSSVDPVEVGDQARGPRAGGADDQAGDPWRRCPRRPLPADALLVADEGDCSRYSSGTAAIASSLRPASHSSWMRLGRFREAPPGHGVAVEVVRGAAHPADVHGGERAHPRRALPATSSVMPRPCSP